MQAKPEFRKSERFDHESIIMLGEDHTLSPYYAASYNLSETGMYFKSLFQMYPGTQILIKIDDYKTSRNQVPAKVVWCKELENTATFRYGVGVEFISLEKNVGVKAPLPITPRMKTPNKKEGGVVIQMEKQLPEGRRMGYGSKFRNSRQ
jgi:Tfp pilus assembly protein PilZ